ELLPRDEIRMVLEDGRDDPIPGVDVRAAPGVCDEVHALGRVPDEDHFTVVTGTDEARDLRARALERRGRLLAELVDAAVDVRVVLLEHRAHRIDHLTRLLTRRGIVEVHDRLPVDGARQYGEICTDLRDVERREHLGARLDRDRHAQALPAYSSSRTKS